MKSAPVLLALLTLAACGTAEPESAANLHARTENEIVERARAINAQVENELAQTERRLEEEASAALNSLNAAAANNAGEANEANEAAPAAAPGNRRR